MSALCSHLATTPQATRTFLPCPVSIGVVTVLCPVARFSQIPSSWGVSDGRHRCQWGVRTWPLGKHMSNSFCTSQKLSKVTQMPRITERRNEKYQRSTPWRLKIAAAHQSPLLPLFKVNTRKEEHSTALLTSPSQGTQGRDGEGEVLKEAKGRDVTSVSHSILRKICERGLYIVNRMFRAPSTI